jgi:hypothetical protein
MQTTGSTCSPTPLDLSQAAVVSLWRNRGVTGLISAMERCEPWTVDSRPEFQRQAELVIAQITDILNGTTPEVLSKSFSQRASLVIDFLGYLRTGRALALFAWLTDVHPSIPEILVDEARNGFDSNGYGMILIERITVLEKQHLLSRVFSPERIALVLELLGEAGLDSSSN